MALNTSGDALTVSSVRDAGARGGPSPAFEAGLRKGDRIVAVWDGDGRIFQVQGLFDLFAARRELDFAKPWQALIERDAEDGRTQALRVEIPPCRLEQPRGVPLGSLALRVGLPLLCLLTGVFIGLAKLEDEKAFLAALLFFAFANASPAGAYASFPAGLREVNLVVAATLFSFWSYLFMRFFLVYPSPSPIDRRFPRLKSRLVVFPFVFAVWNIMWAYSQGLSFTASHALDASLGWLDIILDVFFIALFALGFVSLILNVRKAAAQDERRRLAILLAGSLGILPALVLYFCRVVVRAGAIPEWAYLVAGTSVALFPMCFAYAVVRHRVLGVRLILRRGLQYAFLSRGFLFLEGAGLFLAIFYLADPLLGELHASEHTGALALATALVTMVFVLILRRMNKAVMQALDRRFFREAYDARRILTDLGQNLERFATRPGWVVQMAASKIMDSLHPDQIGVFVRGTEIVRLPGKSEHERRVLGQLEGPTDDFVCFWRHLRSDDEDVDGVAGECAPEILPAESQTGRRLEAMADSTPCVLGVDPHDPDGTRKDRSYHPGPSTERELFRRYNTSLLVPLVAHRRLIGFLTLGEKRSEEPYTREDKDLLLGVGRQLASTLAYAASIQQEAEQLKLRHDISIARNVQTRLLPQNPPEIAGLDYVGACTPARGVGGDSYDFIRVGPERLGMAVGDVCGKGVPAALLMASLQTMLRIHADVHGDNVDLLAQDINRLLCEITDTNRFATFFFGLYDGLARTLTYVNAGHNPPMLLRPVEARSLGGEALKVDGEAETTYEVHRLKPTGMVLGVSPQAKYSKAVLPLRPGDTLVVFTDGITEAQSPSGEEYGEGRLTGVLTAMSGGTAEALRRAVFQDVQAFMEDAPQTDDMTLLVARIRGS